MSVTAMGMLLIFYMWTYFTTNSLRDMLIPTDTETYSQSMSRGGDSKRQSQTLQKVMGRINGEKASATSSVSAVTTDHKAHTQIPTSFSQHMMTSSIPHQKSPEKMPHAGRMESVKHSFAVGGSSTVKSTPIERNRFPSQTEDVLVSYEKMIRENNEILKAFQEDLASPK
jgi:hypothetical protein